jgi:hypothetical protein
MIEVAVVADLGGFPDHHAHAVINHQPPADFRGRVDLDPGQPAGNMRGEPSQQAQVVLPEPMRQPVPHQGMQSRVAQQDLEPGSRCRVAFPICPDRLTQEHESHATFPL